MQRHAWTKAFVEAFGDEYALRAVVVSSGSEVVGIAPLAKPRRGLGKLVLAGAAEMAEPQDFVYRDAAALAELASAVVGLRRPLLLGRVMDDSPTVELLRGAYGAGFFNVRD